MEVLLLRSRVEASVEVEAAPAVLDWARTMVGQKVNGAFSTRLPNDRQYQTVIALLPGVVEATNPYVHGAAGADNLYLVDGADATDPMTRTWSLSFNFDAIEEVEGVTAGASAEYGKSTGGGVNLVTKSGGNDFHGLARLTVSDESWNAKLRGDRTAFSDPSRYSSEVRPSLTLGGPILRDRLWFFGAYEHRDQKRPTTRYLSVDDALAGELTPAETTQEGHYLSVKLSAQATPWLQLVGLYLEDPIEVPMLYAWLGNVNRSPDADNLRRQGGRGGLFDATALGGADVLATFKVSLRRSYVDNLPNTDATSYFSPAGGGFTWGSTNRDFRTGRDHDIYALSGTRWLSGATGSHEVKAGVELAQLSLSTYDEPYPGNELIRLKADGVTPDRRQVYRQRPGWVPTTEQQWSLFAQGSWRLAPRLTVNVGVRLEPLVDRNSAGEIVVDWGFGDRVQPRLGLAWDPGGARWAFVQTYTVGATKATRDVLASPYRDEATVGYRGRVGRTATWGSTSSGGGGRAGSRTTTPAPTPATRQRTGTTSS